jgi:hypothetical protein
VVTRVLLRWLLAVVLVVAAVLFGWRVLAPAEVLAPASTPYPALPVHRPGVTGRTSVAPLIVDGRIRVYAAKRQVRADAPVDGKTLFTPRWSFRRWPQQLAGVVAIGPTVISRWSDGELVAIDGRTGEIAWRSAGPQAPGYTGHRTGAATVWAPPGLHVAAGAVVVTAARKVTAYDVGTGTRRWQIDVPAACADGFTTVGHQYLCATGAYDTRSGQPLGDWPAGPYTPLDCDVAASDCTALRDGAGRGWFVDGMAPRPAAALDRPGSTVAAGHVFFPIDGGLATADPAGGIGRRFPEGQVLGASYGNVVLLGADRRLREVDPATGTVVADYRLAVGIEPSSWKPGLHQVASGYVAIERLSGHGPADPDAPNHYFTVDTVVIGAL